MAGRFLLIEFDSEETANSLRAKIEDASRRGKGYRVVGLFARPGPNFCRCGEDLPYSVHEYERGRKYIQSKVGQRLGWRVCLECRKPLPVMSFLRNLIKPDEIINPTTHEGKYKGRKYNLMFHFIGIGAPTRAVSKASKK